MRKLTLKGILSILRRRRLLSRSAFSRRHRVQEHGAAPAALRRGQALPLTDGAVTQQRIGDGADRRARKGGPLGDLNTSDRAVFAYAGEHQRAIDMPQRLLVNVVYLCEEQRPP